MTYVDLVYTVGVSHEKKKIDIRGRLASGVKLNNCPKAKGQILALILLLPNYLKRKNH